jgi:hypothetical protein
VTVEVATARRLFNREEYHRMGEVGPASVSPHVFPDVVLTLAEIFA